MSQHSPILDPNRPKTYTLRGVPMPYLFVAMVERPPARLGIVVLILAMAECSGGGAEAVQIRLLTLEHPLEPPC